MTEEKILNEIEELKSNIFNYESELTETESLLTEKNLQLDELEQEIWDLEQEKEDFQTLIAEHMASVEGLTKDLELLKLGRVKDSDDVSQVEIF